jgi:predicted RNase H-like HicB family nuclease
LTQNKFNFSKIISMLRYAIIIEKASDGGFGAYVPDLPGCIGMGGTREEAINDVAAGIKLHLDGMKEEGIEIPQPNAEAENLVFEYVLC